MIQREQYAIHNLVRTQWRGLSTAAAAGASAGDLAHTAKLRDDLSRAFPTLLRDLDTLAGPARAAAAFFGLTTSVNVYSAPIGGWAAAWHMANPAPRSIHSFEDLDSYKTLAVAVATSKTKWADISGAVALFIIDTNASETIEEFDKATQAFTTAFTK